MYHNRFKFKLPISISFFISIIILYFTIMKPNFKDARFHVDYGPTALFERIRFKFQDARELQLHGSHFEMRAQDRAAPIKNFRHFNPKIWKLVMAEVRTDTGKFVNTTWEVEIAEQLWWVVIGFNDTIMTVIGVNKGRKGSSSPDIIRNGDLHRFVEDVYATLIQNSEK